MRSLMKKSEAAGHSTCSARKGPVLPACASAHSTRPSIMRQTVTRRQHTCGVALPSRDVQAFWSPVGQAPAPQVDFQSSGQQIDVLGLCQAMVDLTSALPDQELLSQHPFNVAKGARRIINLAERHDVLEALEVAGCDSQVSPGGSLANTLVAISRLAHAHGSNLRVSMAGSVGVDTLGCYFNAQLQQAGVKVIVDQDNICHTGTVMVLTTPDAQRSFLSFFDSGSVRMTPTQSKAISSSQVVVIEGYMLEMPGADTWLPAAVRQARAAGAQVVLTAGDATVVSRHKAALDGLLKAGLVDLLFCNREEACELLGLSACDASYTSSALAGMLAAYSSLSVVTDGSRGASLGKLGEVLDVPPFWAPQGPVDVCGAGDAYCGGILYAILSGYDMKTAGQFASRVAAMVIGRHGAQLEVEDAHELVRWLPDHVLLPTRWSSSGGRTFNPASSSMAA